MKSEVMQKLISVVNALNTVSVCGKANLTYLTGCIAMLEELIQMLNGASIEEIPETK